MATQTLGPQYHLHSLLQQRRPSRKAAALDEGLETSSPTHQLSGALRHCLHGYCPPEFPFSPHHLLGDKMRYWAQAMTTLAEHSFPLRSYPWSSNLCWWGLSLLVNVALLRLLGVYQRRRGGANCLLGHPLVSAIAFGDRRKRLSYVHWCSPGLCHSHSH